MLNGELGWMRILVAVVNSFTILTSLSILWIYVKVPRLSQNPGKVIIAVFVFQAFYSFFLLLSQFYNLEGNEGLQPQTRSEFSFTVTEYQCAAIGIMQEFIQIQLIALNFFLVANLYLQLHNYHVNFRALVVRVIMVSVIFSLAYSLYTALASELSIGPLGDCSVKDNSEAQRIISYASLVVLCTMMLLLVSIFVRRKQFRLEIEIYSTDVEKFQRKYLQTYLRVNLLYSAVFISFRVLPMVVLLVRRIHNPRHVEEAYLVLVSLSGLVLGIVRIQEPIFSKHFYKQLMNKTFKTHKLAKRLVKTSVMSEQIQSIIQDQQESSILDVQNLILHQNDYNDIQDIEVSYYTLKPNYEPKHETNKLKSSYTMPATSQYLSKEMDKQVMLSEIAQLRNEHLIKVHWFKLIAAMHVILTVPESPATVLKRQASTRAQQRSFNFSYLRRMILACRLLDTSVEQLIEDRFDSITINSSDGSIGHPQPYIEETSENQAGAFEVYVYGLSILQSLCEQHTAIQYGQIVQSLNVMANLAVIRQLNPAQMAQHGTMFVSHDNYVSLDIISTRHKTYLTRGGGLLQLWRVWADNLERKESMLPYIVAVACFRFKGLPAINIAVRVNRVHYMYPRCEEGWLKQDCLNGLLKSNVIGWISLKNQTVIKRFLAKSVKDGQFQIVLNRQDFQLLAESKENLIKQLKRDWEVLAHFGSSYHTLQFVFCKYTSKRLMSLMQHEENGEELSYIDGSIERDPRKSIRTSTCLLGQYELQSSLGFAEVFWDEHWQEQTLHNEQEHDEILQRMIETIVEQF